MKRNADQISPDEAVDIPPPQPRRMSSTNSIVSSGDYGAAADDGEVSGSAFLLKSQNRSLSMEVLRQKRALVESRKELELMRRKSREMEALVSLIQRAWSQLDIDACMLLDSLGDSEVGISDEGCSELLHRLVHTESVVRKLDPTAIEQHLPELELDQWSSEEEVEQARRMCEEQVEASNAPVVEGIDRLRKLEEKLEQKQLSARENSKGDASNDEAKEEKGADNENQMDVDKGDSNAVADTERPDQQDLERDAAFDEQLKLDAKYGGPVEENLASHVSFTLSLLERLCGAINDCEDISIQVDTVTALSDIRELRMEKLFLCDKITKLTAEIVNLNARVQQSENQRRRAERDLDRAAIRLKEMENNSGQSSSASSGESSNGKDVTNGDGIAESKTDSAVSAGSNNSSGLEREMRRQIVLLEKQLNESETARAAVEMKLTERMARPLPQTEVQITDMRNAMEELRQQCKQRVNTVIAESEAMQKKIENLELAVCQAETTCSARIEEVVTLTEKAIATAKSEKEALQKKLDTAQADITMTEQLKKQLSDYQALEERNSGEINSLEQKVKSFLATQRLLENDLKKSREREAALEKASLEQTSDGSKVTDSTLLEQAQQRAQDLQSELENARTNINELILEIEAVSSEESKSRSQCGDLLKQISDCQRMQRVALEENLHLQNENEDLKKSHKEIESKMETMKVLMTQQDGVITHQRTAEQVLRAESQVQKKKESEMRHERHRESQTVVEAKQDLTDKKHEVEKVMKRNEELQGRCDELAANLESERRARMDLQKELTKEQKAAAKKEKSAATALGVSGNSEDSTMLEMTLGMLRCSVCKDRFKSAAITRCFHLFCRECIDENLRNRSRKCPACGEKFGQDDVTNIFFN